MLRRQDIYQGEGITKSHVYRAAQQRPDKYNIFTVRDTALHRTKRRLIGQVISERSIKAFEPNMIDQVNIFLGQILRSTESAVPINMTLATRYLGIDIVGHLGYGYGLNLQVQNTNRFLTKAFTIGNFRINICMQFPLLAAIRPEIIASFLPNSLRARLMDLLEIMITKRLSQPIKGKHDLVSFVADSLNVNSIKDLREGDLWPEAAFFFPAAGETTASALAASFFYLANNLECYQKLAMEIRTSFNSGDEIRGGPRLSSCRYLRACIDEALRMSPPVPGTLWREMTPERDGRDHFIVDGHVVPRGTLVGVNIYSIHHNDEYFPDPFAYRPERWMQKTDTPDDVPTKNSIHSAFTPFSIGSRGCAGKAMAYLEAGLVLAQTLWYFDFEKVPGKSGEVGGGAAPGRTSDTEAEFQIYDIFAASHDGPNLIFHPRGNFCDDLRVNN